MSRIIDILAVRGEADLDRGELDYLDVLSDLVAAYEDRHCVIPPDARLSHEEL